MSTNTTYSNDGASSDGVATQQPPSLSLPEIPDIDDESSGFVNRTVTLTLGVIAAFLGGGLLVAALVTIDLTVEAPGRLEPQTIWPVRAQVAGTVADVPVASGDTVSAGRVLVRLDSVDLMHRQAELAARIAAQRLAVRRARAAAGLDAQVQQHTQIRAEAAVIRARADLRDRLAAHGKPTDVDAFLATYTAGRHVGLDRAVSALRTARADVQTAAVEQGRTAVWDLDVQAQGAELRRLQAEMERLQTQRRRTTLPAPADGVVLTERLERLHGQYVQPGDLLVEVAALDGWRVHTYVREQDVHEIEPGDRAKVEIRAFRDESRELVDATVTAVAAEPSGPGDASVPQASGRYRVTLHLHTDGLSTFGPERMRQGYTVEGKIITRSGRMLTLAWEYLVGRDGK